MPTLFFFYSRNADGEGRQNKGWVSGKLAVEFHRTPWITAILGATHWGLLNLTDYTLTFLPGMLLLLPTDASFEAKAKTRAILFPCSEFKGVSKTIEHLRDFHPRGSTSVLPIKPWVTGKFVLCPQKTQVSPFGSRTRWVVLLLTKRNQ